MTRLTRLLGGTIVVWPLSRMGPIPRKKGRAGAWHIAVDLVKTSRLKLLNNASADGPDPICLRAIRHSCATIDIKLLWVRDRVRVRRQLSVTTEARQSSFRMV
ncbi:hypothetical protein AcW1_006345 [Taiwanofungus camphoratus]|nr:hypothetical protein AcW2_005110 [Antrodia cinnamomea]KAI0954456.1 hypothetical protein AcW1_006345 [Antrodia cinnamomea]